MNTSPKLQDFVATVHAVVVFAIPDALKWTLLTGNIGTDAERQTMVCSYAYNSVLACRMGSCSLDITAYIHTYVNKDTSCSSQHQSELQGKRNRWVSDPCRFAMKTIYMFEKIKGGFTGSDERHDCYLLSGWLARSKI